MQVYSIPQVLVAWGHFYFAFHWITLALVMMRFVLPRPRGTNGKTSPVSQPAAEQQQPDTKTAATVGIPPAPPQHAHEL
jgi:hypothetical protein